MNITGQLERAQAENIPFASQPATGVSGRFFLDTTNNLFKFDDGNSIIRTVVTLDNTQTLTNKTFTSPTINAGALSGTFSGTPTFSGALIHFTNRIDFGTNPSTGGLVGFPNNDGLSWRNAANNANLAFYVDASNIFQVPTATTITGAFVNTTTLTSGGVNTFQDTTDSSSSTTGSAKFAGGVGVAKKLYVGGAILSLSNSNSGGDVATFCTNSSNTSASDARVIISSGGSSGGDSYITLAVGGVFGWAIGLDNSDTDALVIAPGSIGSNTFLKCTTAGAWTIGESAGSQVHSVNGTFAMNAANEIRFYNSATTQYVGFKAGTLSGNRIWTLPTADGSSNQAIVTNGSGVLSFQTISASVNESFEVTNAVITPSVAASALTVALKTKAGTDPAGGDVVLIGFRSSTLTSGIYVQRSVTAALSLVVSSGSTLGHVSAVAERIYVYAIDNAGTVELAVSNSPVNETILQTTTVLAGGGADDSAVVLYSTTARSNVAVRLLAILITTQATAGTWASAPSAVSMLPLVNPIARMHYRQAAATVGVGGIAVSASSGSFTGTSISDADITNLSVTITTSGRPVRLQLQAAPSAIAAVELTSSTSEQHTAQVIFDRGGSAISRQNIADCQTGAGGTSDTQLPPSAFGHTDYDLAAGTYTYKARYKITAGTVTFNCTNSILVAYEL